MILMDNDPCHDSRATREALKDIGPSFLEIPTRLQDLNPIESVFHHVKRELEEQTTSR